MQRKESEIFLDESIHQSLGFIVASIIFSDGGLNELVESALARNGLKPGEDEFKSGLHIGRNPEMAVIREELLHIAAVNTRIGLLFVPLRKRLQLGELCLDALEILLRRNAISSDGLTIYFDEGMFFHSSSATQNAGSMMVLSKARVFPDNQSHICLGIQVADAVAHTAAQIVRQDLTGIEKMINIGGEGTGYHPDEDAPLGWVLRTGLRQAFFRRPVIQEGFAFDPATEPLIVPEDEDLVDRAIQPEIIGWGVHLDDELSSEVQDAVRRSLGTIWLGCIH